MSDYIERLDETNASIKTMNIKGKEYAQVNQRILAFWSLFPEGRIVTEKLRDDGQRCDIVARVYADRESVEPIATGHAYEVTQGNVNRTSYVENCETSAVGRALGMLGIGATESLASAEEVQSAIMQQEDAPKNRQVQQAQPQQQPQQQQPARDHRKPLYDRVATLKHQAIENGVLKEGIDSWYASRFGDAKLNQLDDAQMAELLAYLEDMVSSTSDWHLNAG